MCYQKLTPQWLDALNQIIPLDALTFGGAPPLNSPASIPSSFPHTTVERSELTARCRCKPGVVDLLVNLDVMKRCLPGNRALRGHFDRGSSSLDGSF
jgi:hypothetical protein